MPDVIQKSLVLAVLGSAILTGSSAEPPANRSPLTTYAHNRCGGVPPDWGRQVLTGWDEYLTRLDVKSSAFRWNSFPVDKVTLRRYLAEMSKLTSQPGMVIVLAESTDCATVVTVRRMIDDTLHCGAKRLCIESTLPEWNRMDPPPPRCDASCRAFRRGDWFRTGTDGPKMRN